VLFYYIFGPILELFQQRDAFLFSFYHRKTGKYMNSNFDVYLQGLIIRNKRFSPWGLEELGDTKGVIYLQFECAQLFISKLVIFGVKKFRNTAT